MESPASSNRADETVKEIAQAPDDETDPGPHPQPSVVIGCEPTIGEVEPIVVAPPPLTDFKLTSLLTMLSR